MKITNVKTLLEKNRQELLNKQKREAPKRIKRANSYSVTDISIDSSALVNDWLVITTTISGNSSNYSDSIAFKNVMTDLISLAKIDSSHYVNSKLIIRSIKRSLDSQDVYISCDCDDFKFTYDYWSSHDKFKWGKLQSSNGKGIRNPHNDKGSMCKHLYALLRSNNFLDKVSDKIMRTIMANLDVLVKNFKINLEEFIVNSDRYDRMLKANSRDASGRFIKKDYSTNTEKTKTESIENSDNVEYDSNKLLQYFTNEQILLMLKEILDENEYIHFIKNNGKEQATNYEDYILNNISKTKLMELIKTYNDIYWNILIRKMASSIYN